MTTSKPSLPDSDRERLLEALRAERDRRRKQNPIKYWTPRSKQVEFFERARKAMLMAWLGANRSGKTVGACAYIAERILEVPVEEWSNLPAVPTAANMPGSAKEIWLVALSFEKSRDVQQKHLFDLIPPAWRGKASWDPSSGLPNGILSLANGSVIHFKYAGQDPTTFESNKVHSIWLDEAIPLAIFLRCLGRIVDLAGQIIVTSIRELPWFEDIFVAGQSEFKLPGAIDYITSTIYDNAESLDATGIALFEASLGMISEDERRMRIEGESMTMEGRVYKEEGPEHWCDPFPIPPDWSLGYCIDPGYRNPCAVLFVAIDPREEWWFYDEIYETGRQVPDIAAMIKERQLVYPQDHHLAGRVRQVQWTLIDPESQREKMGQLLPVIDQFRQAGIQAAPADNRVWDGIMKVKALLKPKRNGQAIPSRLHFFNTLAHLRHEFRHYMWVPRDIDTGEMTGDREQVKKAKDHLMDCMRYLVNAECGYVPPAAPPPIAGTLAHRWEIDQAEEARKRASYRRV